MTDACHVLTRQASGAPFRGFQLKDLNRLEEYDKNSCDDNTNSSIETFKK